MRATTGAARSALEIGAWLIVLYGVGRALHSEPVDDSFIFFRYATNLAEGHGFRFNPTGEPVEGFTSVLWVCLLGAWAKVGGDLPQGARWISLLFGAASVALCVPRLREGGRREVWTWVLKLSLASCPAYAFWAGTGMDLSAFMLVTVLIARQVARPGGPSWKVGLLLGFGAWVRPEALFVWLPWVVVACVWHAASASSFRLPLQISGAAALVVGPQYLLRWLMFHRLFPNTYYAKVGLPLLDALGHGFRYVWHATPEFLGWLVMGSIVGVVAFYTKKREALVLLSGAVFWILYVVLAGGDHFPMGRFLLPAVPLVIAACAVLLGSAPSLHERLALRVALASVLLGSIGSYRSAESDVARACVATTRAWANTGRWLRENERPGTRIATVPAGAIPYWSGMETFDMLGLVTSEGDAAWKTYASAAPGHQHYNTDALLRFNPDVIVFNGSGRFLRKRMMEPDSISLTWNYPFYAALHDQRVRERFEPEAHQLPDGTWVEFLRRK
jgi:hypothetical protein